MSTCTVSSCLFLWTYSAVIWRSPPPTGSKTTRLTRNFVSAAAIYPTRARQPHLSWRRPLEDPPSQWIPQKQTRAATAAPSHHRTFTPTLTRTSRLKKSWLLKDNQRSRSRATSAGVESREGRWRWREQRCLNQQMRQSLESRSSCELSPCQLAVPLAKFCNNHTRAYLSSRIYNTFQCEFIVYLGLQ